MSKQEIKERAVEEHGVASYDLPKKSLLIAFCTMRMWY